MRTCEEVSRFIKTLASKNHGTMPAVNVMPAHVIRAEGDTVLVNGGGCLSVNTNLFASKDAAARPTFNAGGSMSVNTDLLSVKDEALPQAKKPVLNKSLVDFLSSVDAADLLALKLALTGLQEQDTQEPIGKHVIKPLPVESVSESRATLPVIRVHSVDTFSEVGAHHTAQDDDSDDDDEPFIHDPHAQSRGRWRRASFHGQGLNATPVHPIGEWSKDALPRRSSISSNTYAVPPLAMTPANMTSRALYKMGVKEAPPRRRSLREKRRVSFTNGGDQPEKVFAVHSINDYDRSGVPSEYELGNFDQVSKEIVDFCENEMVVHKDAEHTVVHDWLKPDDERRSELVSSPPRAGAALHKKSMKSKFLQKLRLFKL